MSWKDLFAGEIQSTDDAYKPIPAGVYVFTITDAIKEDDMNEDDMNDGAPTIKLTYKIYDGAYANRRVWVNYKL